MNEQAWAFVADVESMVQHVTRSPRGLSPEEFDYVSQCAVGPYTQQQCADSILAHRQVSQ